MKIHLEIETPLSREDMEILQRLMVEPWPPVEAAPAKEKKPKAAPAEPEPEPEETAPEVDEDALLKEAIEKGTTLVQAGEHAKVKAALEATGAKRVSQLSGFEAIRQFMDALA